MTRLLIRFLCRRGHHKEGYTQTWKFVWGVQRETFCDRCGARYRVEAF